MFFGTPSEPLRNPLRNPCGTPAEPLRDLLRNPCGTHAEPMRNPCGATCGSRVRSPLARRPPAPRPPGQRNNPLCTPWAMSLMAMMDPPPPPPPPSTVQFSCICMCHHPLAHPLLRLLVASVVWPARSPLAFANAPFIQTKPRGAPGSRAASRRLASLTFGLGLVVALVPMVVKISPLRHALVRDHQTIREGGLRPAGPLPRVVHERPTPTTATQRQHAQRDLE